jgi:hypothetical protein
MHCIRAPIAFDGSVASRSLLSAYLACSNRSLLDLRLIRMDSSTGDRSLAYWSPVGCDRCGENGRAIREVEVQLAKEARPRGR